MSSIKPDGSPGRQARHRILNRAVESVAQASPLAQLFQPLIVDEAIPENTYLNAGTRDGVSYGPVSRRRLSSATTLQRVAPTSRENENEVVSSPGQGPGWSGLLWEPETAEETQEEEAGLGSLEWARRLDSIEKRQKRIEGLLGDILAAVGKSDTGG